MKRLGKDLSKKFVASDYKNNRVADPTAKLNEKQARKVKTYSKDFLDRAVHKFEAQKKEQGDASGSTDNAATELSGAAGDNQGNDAELSDVNMDDSPASRKRKHDDVAEGDADTDLPDATTPTTDGPEVKRLREDEGGAAATPSPPPPPPPPPQDAEPTEEQRALQEQERALERENEEAQRLEDEAQRTTNGEPEQNRKQEVLSH